MKRDLEKLLGKRCNEKENNDCNEKTMTNEEKIEWFNHAIASLEHHAIKSKKYNSDSE